MNEGLPVLVPGSIAGGRVGFARRLRPIALVACVAMGAASVSMGCKSNKGTQENSESSGASAGQGGQGGEAGSAASLCPEDQGGAAGSSDQGDAGESSAPELTIDWDLNGVVGTGQSLAVGQFGTPAEATTQPYDNLKLDTGTADWPIDPEDPSFELVPLTEPIGRPSTSYPSSYPTNIAGETPHAAMANQITALVSNANGPDFVGVHGEFGENGQCIGFLEKDTTPTTVNGRAYKATLLETEAITRLAEAQGKSYGVGAVIVTHGECDAGNTNYEADLYQLWSDYNTDIPAITGQTRDLLMIVSQQNSVNSRSASTLAQWKIGVDYPDQIVCSGPKYQYPYYPGDHVHLVTAGYEQLGEKYGQIYFERVVLGRPWQPLQPTRAERTGDRLITVQFHVPVPPLVWETAFQPPYQSVDTWKAGRGFEVRGPSSRIQIDSVEICGDSVVIACGSDLPETGVTVGYAMTGESEAMSTPFEGTFRWGLLRDSDPFVGSTTHTPQPNYAVAFEMPVL